MPRAAPLGPGPGIETTTHRWDFTILDACPHGTLGPDGEPGLVRLQLVHLDLASLPRQRPHSDHVSHSDRGGVGGQKVNCSMLLPATVSMSLRPADLSPEPRVEVA